MRGILSSSASGQSGSLLVAYEISVIFKNNKIKSQEKKQVHTGELGTCLISVAKDGQMIDDGDEDEYDEDDY